MDMWTQSWLEAIRDKCKRYPQARAAYDRFRSDQERLVSQRVAIPLLEGGWSHDYNCPNDGDRLILIDRHHHRCPTCNEVWSGKPWDDVAVANEHWNYARTCRNASVVSAIEGNGQWAEWSKQVLMSYADHYEGFELHDRYGGASKTSGKVMCQTLSEASWLCLLAQAYHILKEQGVLSPEECRHIADKLLYPAIEVINNNPAGISNWQTYHNAAKALTAAAVGDRDLMDQVLHDPENGFYFQMENSLGEDGFWYEGAWGYHFYTLEAQTLIVLAAQSFNLRLYEEPRFQSMYRAPLECMQPDGTLSAIHDSGVVPIQKYFHLYEFAAKYIGIGSEVLEGAARDSLYSFLFGFEEEPEGSAYLQPLAMDEPDSRFVHLKKAGMLFLKRDAGAPDQGQVAMVDYGEHGGWHGHQDKLNLLFYAGGHPWLEDAGMLPYGNPIHFEYFKQTVAHNTVAVGGRSQAEAEGSIELMQRRPDGTLEAVMDAGEAYPGARLRRKIVLTGDVLLDAFQIRCDEEQTVDWIIHTQGKPFLPDGSDADEAARLSWREAEEGSLGSEDGFSYLQKLQAASPEGKQWRADWQWNKQDAAGDRLQLIALDVQEGEQVFMAETMAMPSVGKRSTLIRRRTGVKETVFVSLFRATKGDESAIPVKAEYGAQTGQVVVHIGGKEPVVLSASFE